MTLLICWLVFPAVLVALSLGCGLLVQRIAGVRLPGALVPGVGLGTMIVVGQAVTVSDATAEFAVPLVVALAVAGVGLSFPWPFGRFDPWALAAAVGVFGVFAAPIVFSGEPTFGGYIKLDDTASWLALTDRIMDHGRSLTGLAPSSYEATLHFYLDSDYPVGGFVPLGIGHVLVNQDSAWLYQPYMAVLAAMLGLALYELAGSFSAVRWYRALAAFVAAQPALLFGYTLWGGLKEQASAWLVALLAALLVPVVRGAPTVRMLIAPAVAAAATLAVLSYGGGVWLAALLLPAFVGLLRLRGRRVALGQALRFAALAILMSIPSLLLLSFLGEPAASTITTQSRLANLIHPLSPFQVLGIWPARDFRLDPDDTTVTVVLIGLVVVAAAIGIAWALRGRAWPFLLYVVAAALGGGVIYSLASPWVDAKALAIASPAALLAAAAGVAALLRSRRVTEAVIVGALITGGVVWSNALAYQGASLGPHDRLAELERIGERFAGQGPTLMTEYEPFGVRHFLRRMDPEGASELRRRQIPLRNGRLLGKSQTADIDQFDLKALLVYRTLVLRRSPVASRPPSAYHLASSGRYYDVWQRPQRLESQILSLLPLGNALSSGGTPRCSDVIRLARSVRGGGRLAAVASLPATVVSLRNSSHPAQWDSGGNASSIVPRTSGTVRLVASVPVRARYGVWVGGSFRGGLEVLIDGRKIGSFRHELSHGGGYIQFGEAPLVAGPHQVTMRYRQGGLHPGSAGFAFPLGPLVLSREGTNRRVFYVPPSKARTLCGQRLDWVEAIR